MSVTVRLARTGRKNAPAFKIIATKTRTKRYGQFLDILGYYNPSHNPVQFELDEEKLKDWVAKGALVSEAVQKLKEGTYVYKPYNPNAKEEEVVEEAAGVSEASEEETTEEATTEDSEE